MHIRMLMGIAEASTAWVGGDSRALALDGTRVDALVLGPEPTPIGVSSALDDARGFSARSSGAP